MKCYATPLPYFCHNNYVKFLFPADDEYMAFGLSGSPKSTTMDDADVVVAHYTNGQPKADDYFLNQRAQVGKKSLENA